MSHGFRFVCFPADSDHDNVGLKCFQSFVVQNSRWIFYVSQFYRCGLDLVFDPYPLHYGSWRLSHISIVSDIPAASVCLCVSDFEHT